MQAGDSVWNFAQQYNTTVDTIAQRNQLTNPNFIQIGQKLIIPDSATGAGSLAPRNAGVAATNSTTATAATTVTSTDKAMTSTAAKLTTSSTAPTTVINAASSATNLDSTTTVLRNTPASAATSTSQAATSAVASQTDYAANSAAALQSMSNYVISYGTVEETAASYNNGSQVAQPTQTASSSQTTTSGSTANISGAVATAKSMIGVPYVWGGNTPSGFDCSGLVQYAYNLGPNYRTTYQQTNLGTHKYDVENAQSGDLYFWGTENAPYHVAIAEGNGNYIQAPTPGQNVQEGNIQYYRPNYYISMGQ